MSLLSGVVLIAVGCDWPELKLWDPKPAPAPAPAPPPLVLDGPAPGANAPVDLVPAARGVGATSAERVRLDVVLTVLRVQVPSGQRAQAEPIWNHLREDVLDAQSALRLRQNGIRAGVGHTHWWDAVKATLDAVEGVHSLALDPMRVPPDYPVALELDTQPREQTLFFVAEDGVLTGETWPQSRNVLRVSYGLDRAHPERVRLLIVPEVRQRLDGWRWVRSESGLLPAPEYNGRAFGAAAIAADLAPGEFLLVAPGEQAELYGLLGGVFLSGVEDGEHYDSYVFLRADMNHVAYRN
ncbi:MAG TPA: hypothetical protein PLQ87_00510 [Phycisphaerae bacterium]|nr:hypothetical protein [Phycisphaerae bacterium]